MSPLRLDAMLCCAMLCYTLLCYAMLCDAMRCYAILCYAMLCYVMICYAYDFADACYALLCFGVQCTGVFLLRRSRWDKPSDSTEPLPPRSNERLLTFDAQYPDACMPQCQWSVEMKSAQQFAFMTLCVGDHQHCRQSRTVSSSRENAQPAQALLWTPCCVGTMP